MDVPVRVRDMSLGGMSLETSFPFSEGVVHEFQLTLGDDSTVLLRGRVLRSRSEPGPENREVFISGIQFVDEEQGDGPIGGFIEKLE
jgi:hypothetical protein